METLSVQFLAPHLWRLAVLLIPALALAFWTYYGILAPLSRPARWVLWTLRGLAFLLVLFALGQPVATAVLSESGRPRLAVLIDRSVSMRLPAGGEAGETRAEQAASVAASLESTLGDRFRLQWHGFADAILPAEADSASGPEGNTAIGGALETLLSQADSRPIAGIIVVTDGVNTTGRDPVRIAQASPIPVFAVDVSPEDAPEDLEIRRLRTNPTAFAGEPLPIQVTLSSKGFGGRTVRLDVRQGDQVLATREVVLAGGEGLEQEIDLEVRPRAPGLALFDVTVDGIGDVVPENDHRQVAVEVLERKTRILVMSGRLDWDFSFLRRTLGADTTLGYTFLAQTRPGEYRAWGEKRLERPPRAEAELREFAAVILSGYETQGPPTETINVLARFVRAGGGLFLLGGPDRPGGWIASSAIAPVLPGSVGADPLPATDAMPVALTVEGQRHPASAVRDNPAETAQLWAALPPLWRSGGALELRPDARKLLEYRSTRGAGPAALAVSFHERGKSAWLHGRGAWRWAFLPAGGPAPADVYPQFLLGIVRWLAEPAVRDRFQAAPGKRVYQNGEPIAFAASLWNAEYAPLADARILVEVYSAADSAASSPMALELRPGAEPGRYDAEGPPLPPGAWRYRAVARDGSTAEQVGVTDGRFWVESMGPEFARTAGDRDALEQMARRSGGHVVEASGVAELAERIPRAIRRFGRIREIELWNHWILFASFVAVLSVEWFLRRRRGLA